MLAIRLTRTGRKGIPFYRIIVSEKRYKRDGRYIERLGYYNPLTQKPTVVIDRDRFDHWIKMGAQPTPVIARLVLGVKGTKKRAPKKKALEAETAGQAPANQTENTEEAAPATEVEQKTESKVEENAAGTEAGSEAPKTNEDRVQQ